MEYQHINQFTTTQQLRSAGSNIAFAAVAEISDSVLKGAEANGFNGLVKNYHLLVNLVTIILAGTCSLLNCDEFNTSFLSFNFQDEWLPPRNSKIGYGTISSRNCIDGRWSR